MKPQIKFKDSGIEWNPEIPDSWKVRPVKALYEVQLGKMLQNDSQSSLDEKVPYLKALHVNWNEVEVSELPEMWASLQISEQKDHQFQSKRTSDFSPKGPPFSVQKDHLST